MNVIDIDIDNFTESVQMPLRIYMLGFYWHNVLGIMSVGVSSQFDSWTNEKTRKSQNKQL